MTPYLPGAPLPGPETPTFLARPGGAPVAVVRHAPAGAPRGTVVLAGPMTLERTHGFLTWVRWARTLAASGFEVLRFDFHGVGESPADFRTATFDTWRDELAAVCGLARAGGPGPVMVVGLRLGALLGQAVLGAGGCDALAAWDPPASGRAMLMDMLRRKLAADYMELAGERRTREWYVGRLEAGDEVEVEGFPWTRGLWQSAAGYTFSPPAERRWWAVYLDGRPADRLPELQRYAAMRIPRPAFWLQSAHLVADLHELFAATVERLGGWAMEPLPRQELPPAAASCSPRLPAGPGPSRQLDVAELSTGRCVGTIHRPAHRRSTVGLVWVNSGYVPRDGHGSLAAIASDALAARGIPCYRYDLPGLGDSPGPLPAHTHQFFPVVTGGQLTPVTTELLTALCHREQLDGVVVAGLCGGAVNAIFSADAAPSVVRAMVLLEPELYVTEPGEGGAGGAPRPAKGLRQLVRERLPSDGGGVVRLLDAALRTRLPGEDRAREAWRRLGGQRLTGRLFSYWGWMRLLTHENRYARFVPLPRQLILEYLMGRSELPDVTNVPLVMAWQRLVRAHRPVLVVTAAGKLRETFFDRINASALAGIPRADYRHERLANTNHILTTGGAIARVTEQLLEAWPMLAKATAA